MKTIHPLRRYAPPFGSNVALGSAPLRGDRMTFSHSSKDPLRHPVSGGQFAGAVLAVVTDSPPETGASTPQGGGGG